MAAGGSGKEQSAIAEPGLKGKKKSKTGASFFTPWSKKTKVAKVDVEPDTSVGVLEKRQDEECQEPPATLAALSVKKKPSKKKARLLQEQRRDVENASPLVDAQPGEVQPGVSLELEQEVAPSPTKKLSRMSPAKKKRKAQQNLIESKPAIGVHGPDLFMQARLAAEENARLSAGKATHPFFARPKLGGARSLVTDDAAHNMSVRSLNPAPDCFEKNLRMSPSKPPHPFFSRQHVGIMKPTSVDESPSSYESESLAPCLPLHVTQNKPDVKEEDANLSWNLDWTWRNMPVESDDGEIEGHWSCVSYQPSYTWTWPSSKMRNSKGQPISRVAAFGRAVEYLTGKQAGARYLLGEEVESTATETQKLIEKFSPYYYYGARKDYLEQNTASQPLIERQVKVNCSRNPLWTDQYQPQISEEVCGNNECVKTLSSWLQNWREKILQQKRSSTNKEEDESSSSDDDSDFVDSLSVTDDDDDDDLHNCLLVTGPAGCGKSAAIYACAMEHGFTIIEVNASECRSGALIKHKFKEAMESHGLSKRGSSTPVDAYDGQLDVGHMLKQGESCLRSMLFNEELRNQLSLSESANRINLPPNALRGLRVILFEDVDIVFDEDSGFMGALSLLARTSKCPIIFTSNSQKTVLPQVTRLQVLRFEPPSTAELVAHAYMVCLAEGVLCSPYMVEHIVKTSGHDIRKLLMLLQFWTQGTSAEKTYLKDACVVENPKVPHTSKQNPNLVNCLLQLDCCPQVPATRIHAAGNEIFKEKLNSVEASLEQECRNEEGKVIGGSCQRSDSSRNSKKRSLDTDWLYAHDCQHRVLPLLMPDSEPCLLTATVAGYLEDTRKEIMKLKDEEVSRWSRYRFIELKAKEEADFQARKTLRKLQAAARKEMNGRASEGFSFMKLMQSSYDSPAAQTASNECIKDTLSLLQEHESSSSEEHEADFAPVCEGDLVEPHGVITSDLTPHVDEDCMNLPDDEVPDLNPRSSSSETAWTILDHNCTPGLHSDVSIPDPIALGNKSPQQSIALPDVTVYAGSLFDGGSSAPSGLEGLSVYKPMIQGERDVISIPIDNLTIHHAVEIQSTVAEQSCNHVESLDDTMLNFKSMKMEQLWSKLRSLRGQASVNSEIDSNNLLEGVLQDLSACDFLSSRTASAFKVSAEQNLDYDDCTEDSCWDHCLESAAVLAHLRLNQALNNFLPTNGLCSDTWQVGPSVFQQDAIREEKQVSDEERVDSLLPQRCRLSGRLARLDYLSFQSQLTSLPADSEVETGRATRQRKLTPFE